MTVKIGCIVEGKGEVEAVPILIRRIAENLYPELLRLTHRVPFVFPEIKVVKTGPDLNERVELEQRERLESTRCHICPP